MIETSTQHAAAKSARNHNLLNAEHDEGEESLSRQYSNPRANLTKASKQKDDIFFRSFYSDVCIGRMREIILGRGSDGLKKN